MEGNKIPISSMTLLAMAFAWEVKEQSSESSSNKNYPFPTFQDKVSSRRLHAGWNSAAPSHSFVHFCYAGLDSTHLADVIITVVSCKGDCRVNRLVGSWSLPHLPGKRNRVFTMLRHGGSQCMSICMDMVPHSCCHSPLGVSYAHQEVVELSTYVCKKGILHFFP